MIRPIVRYGDEVLRRRAADVAEVTAEVRALIDDMVETMYAAPGVGLAAPQVGVSLRAFVADPSAGRRPDGLVVMINPTVVEQDGAQDEEEGCLSVPGFNARVRRPARVVLRGSTGTASRSRCRRRDCSPARSSTRSITWTARSSWIASAGSSAS